MSKRLDEFASLRNNEKLMEKTESVPCPQNVDPVAWDGSVVVDKALRFVWYLMLEAVSDLISSNAIKIAVKIYRSQCCLCQWTVKFR